MNIAQPLRKLMDERKLSNSKLAREVGVHTSTVSNWLDGKEVKAENLTALCTYFGCSLDYLAGKMEEAKKAPTPKSERDVDPDIRRIERARKNMSDADKQKMMNILKASFEDYFSVDFVYDDLDVFARN